MLKQGGYAKVDSIKTYAEYNFTKVKLTTTGVGKSGKEYTDFKGFATLFDAAYEKSADLSEGDSIYVLDMGVTSSSSGGRYYTNANIYDMEIIHNENVEVSEDEESLPFS